ncbi:dihydropteroate synthase [Pacificimonas flava]|uniref:dihydropteroate synthase n=1 Tax=Pacificimonas flava TaxID=1234595 RepID=M2U1L7_9SPHN|nr:dihydropteroate synthase [Pacificimonas flava]EMD81723.1 Dihydropteroate synthase [Pacificimonas flava]MBB5279293.1 dihydropteroate synthase [Pacificimonas flava]
MSDIYLRPTGFVDAPFGFDGQVARLAGGMVWFSAVEMLSRDRPARLVPVADMPPLLKEDAALAVCWRRLTEARPALELGPRTLRFDQPQVMGIVNATPDSFSDGGRHGDAEGAAQAAFDMAAAGAALVDLGGESTRPGAETLWEDDEIARVAPVLERLRESGILMSIDTRKSAVMRAALARGARIVNDVSGLTHDGESLRTVADAGAPVVIMHNVGDPKTMQDAPRYDHVLLDVYDWLEGRIAAAVAGGIDPARIIADPGIGFGKTVRHNLELLNGLSLFHGLGVPVLLGASRKGFIGALSGEAGADARLGGSLAAVQTGLAQGVQLFRVHDVPETVQAVRVWRGLRDAALSPAH